MDADRQPTSPGNRPYPRVWIENTEQRSLSSRFVGQEYRLQVYLPPAHADPSRSFPILYLLDSDRSFGMAKDIVEWLNWQQEIPEMIIVGVAYGEGTEAWWQKRSRDYTPTPDRTRVWGDWPLAGGGGAFLSFIREELIPFVDAEYRTCRDDRAIVGLSFGGLFAAYVLFAEPALFRRYIMVSPALLWDDRVVFKHEQEFAKSHDTLPARVYTVVGDLDDRETVVLPWQEFCSILENRHYQGLELTKELARGETHLSVYPGGLARGLRTVFSAR